MNYKDSCNSHHYVWHLLNKTDNQTRMVTLGLLTESIWHLNSSVYAFNAQRNAINEDNLMQIQLNKHEVKQKQVLKRKMCRV